MSSILVYCGSRTGNSPIYALEAARFGELMAQHGFRLLFGGGKVGLMGVISNRILEAGGDVVGVIPEHLVAREVANPHCTELLVVKNMQERKVLMEEMADIIVTLPGGYGSMDEIFESLTNAQLDLHAKPIWLLNTQGFYDALIAQVDKMVEEGFIVPVNREKLKVASTADALMAAILGQ